MSGALTTTLVLFAVSALILGLGRFVRPLGRVCGILGLVWMAAALPLMFFLNLDSQHVLLFYLLSAAIGLIFHMGGRPA